MAIHELTDVQAVALARLRRCARWVEEGRGNGYICLLGIRGAARNTERLRFDEQTLMELLALGLAARESSPRLHEAQPFEARRGISETTVTYWRATV
jgi:hypothetical protein